MIISLLLLWIACAQAKTVDYPPLEGQTWKVCGENSFSFNLDERELPVVYNYCSLNNSISLEFITKEIVETTSAIFEFALSYGLSKEECAYNYKLEIYNVSMTTLNSSKFVDHKKGNVIWGVYDPRVDETIVSSIILTDHGTEQNRLTLGHEMSHYWYDRMCWSGSWREKDKDLSSNETFAQRFERFYQKKIEEK